MNRRPQIITRHGKFRIAEAHPVCVQPRKVARVSPCTSGEGWTENPRWPAPSKRSSPCSASVAMMSSTGTRTLSTDSFTSFWKKAWSGFWGLGTCKLSLKRQSCRATTNDPLTSYIVRSSHTSQEAPAIPRLGNAKLRRTTLGRGARTHSVHARAPRAVHHPVRKRAGDGWGYEARTHRERGAGVDRAPSPRQGQQCHSHPPEFNGGVRAGAKEGLS